LLNYARHFGLLGCFTAALAVAGSSAGPGSIGSQFALYGALHAAALALSIVGSVGPSIGRRLLFVALAAILALSTARLGLLGLHLVGGVGSAGPLAILAVCASVGALAYGALLRGVLMTPGDLGTRLSVRALVMTALGCAAVAPASFAVGRELHANGVLWLVTPWWFAFSCGLWVAGWRGAHNSRRAHKMTR
jgi:hypothetical protein